MEVPEKSQTLPSTQLAVMPDGGRIAGVVPDLNALRAYTHTKLALAGHLRVLREALAALGREHGERQCGDLVVKLAEDRFTLAVLGQFKRGKSSLMNAIIGREILPTGVLPLTSAITVLKYGPTERLIVRREDMTWPEELPISALSDCVTERGNPSNRKKVKTACLELPVPFLRRGIEFVDTPGVGSAITTNTATTYGFLPECDAVLFVTSVDTPMTSTETAFLKEIREYVDRIFFIVNKTDLASDGERSEVLRFVTETIREQTGHADAKVFPVSARSALVARTTGDAGLYEQSGLKALEEALASFLSEERAAVFLAAVAQKALRVFDEEAAQDAFGEASLQARARAIRKDGAVAVHRDPKAAAAAAKGARSKLDALHTGILAGHMAEPSDIDILVAEQVELKSTDAEESSPVASTPEATSITADLRTRGCPVCRHMTEGASDFFAHWQYELATEQAAQAKFAAELGFCPLHAWQLLAISSPHGASVGHARLADQVARHLRESVASPADGNAIGRMVRDARNCRVCEIIRKYEREYVQQLASLISDSSVRATYRRSQGVCLRHLGMLVNACGDQADRAFLLTEAAQRFEEDAEDMQSYAVKHEALRRGLQNRNEEDAYRRAVIRIVGGRSVCVPWAEDGEI